MSGSSIKPAVELESVSYRYRGAERNVLENVSFTVENGEFVYLTGNSGSGKSTLMRLCLLSLPGMHGRLRVLGRDVTRARGNRKSEVRRHMATVFQDFKLLGDRTVGENVAFSLLVDGMRGDVVKARVNEALELVGLGERHRARPGELSGGEQQRVAIARALVGRPYIILADEPTGNLDPSNTKATFDLLERISATGTTVIVATHDHNEVAKRHHRNLHLERGVLSDRRKKQ
jgi:cell division transport system ATP-binding protein